MLLDLALAMSKASTKELEKSIQIAKAQYETLLESEKIEFAIINNCKEKYSKEVSTLRSQIDNSEFWVEALMLMKVIHCH